MTRRESKSRVHGWSPPIQISVHVTEETYQYIKKLALTKHQQSCPFYDTLDTVIKEFEQLKSNEASKLWELEEDLAFTKGHLAIAMDEKKQLEKGNKGMREKYNLSIDKNNDPPVIILSDRREEQVKQELDTEFRKW